MPATADIRQHRQTYQNARVRKLPLPMAANLRAAQVSPRALLFGEAHFFALENTKSLCDFEPQVLIGSSSELATLARWNTEGILNLKSLDRALFVITDCRDVPLRDTARLVLWQAFGVPIYELLLGGNGAMIASECDAHEGWHVEEGITFSLINNELWYHRKREQPSGTGLTGEIDESLCSCGQPGWRILNPAMDFRDPVRHCLAKTA